MENNDHHDEKIFMRRALELAALGRGYVSPNPLVGCVIVHEGKIIGEGWHRKYGGPHAEVNAVNAVRDRAVLTNSTAYVTLEPCAHFGKTPPCADMLVASGIKNVIIANMDPNPQVSGGGIRKLRDGGVNVRSGLLAAEGHELNIRYFTWMEKKRPFFILKWAQTSDGFMAREDMSSKWISHQLSRQLVHQWRTWEDAVLIGTRTAQHDNPLLNVREWTGRNPARIVIDRFLKLDTALNLFDGTQRTLCYNLLRDGRQPQLDFVKLNADDFLAGLIADLYRRNIQSVIVEGGAQTLRMFIDAGIWDECRIFISEKTFGSGVSAPQPPGKLAGQQNLGTDLLKIFKPA